MSRPAVLTDRAAARCAPPQERAGTAARQLEHSTSRSSISSRASCGLSTANAPQTALRASGNPNRCTRPSAPRRGTGAVSLGRSDGADKARSLPTGRSRWEVTHSPALWLTYLHLLPSQPRPASSSSSLSSGMPTASESGPPGGLEPKRRQGVSFDPPSTVQELQGAAPWAAVWMSAQVVGVGLELRGLDEVLELRFDHQSWVLSRNTCRQVRPPLGLYGLCLPIHPRRDLAGSRARF